MQAASLPRQVYVPGLAYQNKRGRERERWSDMTYELYSLYPSHQNLQQKYKGRFECYRQSVSFHHQKLWERFYVRQRSNFLYYKSRRTANFNTRLFKQKYNLV